MDAGNRIGNKDDKLLEAVRRLFVAIIYQAVKDIVQDPLSEDSEVMGQSSYYWIMSPDFDDWFDWWCDMCDWDSSEYDLDRFRNIVTRLRAEAIMSKNIRKVTAYKTLIRQAIGR